MVLFFRAVPKSAISHHQQSLPRFRDLNFPKRTRFSCNFWIPLQDVDLHATYFWNLIQTFFFDDDQNGATQATIPNLILDVTGKNDIFLHFLIFTWCHLFILRLTFQSGVSLRLSNMLQAKSRRTSQTAIRIKRDEQCLFIHIPHVKSRTHNHLAQCQMQLRFRHGDMLGGCRNWCHFEGTFRTFVSWSGS